MKRYATKREALLDSSTDVVILLKPGPSGQLVKLVCVNPFCFRQIMFRTNRPIDVVIRDSKGIHWADVPDDVTVIEHKCRSCGDFYRVYTPSSQEAMKQLKGSV